MSLLTRQYAYRSDWEALERADEDAPDTLSDIIITAELMTVIVGVDQVDGSPKEADRWVISVADIGQPTERPVPDSWEESADKGFATVEELDAFMQRAGCVRVVIELVATPLFGEDAAAS